MLKGKIFVHIGLPKTATTTLQMEIFPRFSDKFIQYLGVFQPREERHQSKIYRHLYESIETGDSIENTREILKAELDLGVALVFSEEMITVSTNISTWREKLKNLGRVLSGLDYTLILTVREPVSAMFSYYVELFIHFSRRNKNFMESTLDDDMQIFHYKKLTDEIFNNFERDRVYAIKFEDVIANNLSKLTQLVAANPQAVPKYSLVNRNKKKKTMQYVYSNNRITMRRMIWRVLCTLNLSDSKVIVYLKSALRPQLVWLDRLAYVKKAKVQKLSNNDKQKLKVQFAKETRALDKYFGIKYE